MLYLFLMFYVYCQNKHLLSNGCQWRKNLQYIICISLTEIGLDRKQMETVFYFFSRARYPTYVSSKISEENLTISDICPFSPWQKTFTDSHSQLIFTAKTAELHFMLFGVIQNNCVVINTCSMSNYIFGKLLL